MKVNFMMNSFLLIVIWMIWWFSLRFLGVMVLDNGTVIIYNHNDPYDDHCNLLSQLWRRRWWWWLMMTMMATISMLRMMTMMPIMPMMSPPRNHPFFSQKCVVSILVQLQVLHHGDARTNKGLDHRRHRWTEHNLTKNGYRFGHPKSVRQTIYWDSRSNYTI